MSIPFNDHLSWDTFRFNPNWPTNQPVPAQGPSIDHKNQIKSTLNELSVQTLKGLGVRGVQFIRDAARLVLKVPIRAIKTPIVLEKNWQQLERAKINAKLTGYSFVQLISVPAKFLVALTALVTLAISLNGSKWLLDKSESWTAHLDGRASQLEALKEVGGKFASNQEEYNKYKDWLYSIDAKLCRKNA